MAPRRRVYSTAWPSVSKGTLALLVFSIALVPFLLKGEPALAAPSIRLNPTSGPPGASVRIDGSGFQPGEPIQIILWDGAPILGSGRFFSTAAGSFSTQIKVPTTAGAGSHSLTAVGVFSGPISASFNVRQPSARTPQTTAASPATWPVVFVLVVGDQEIASGTTTCELGRPCEASVTVPSSACGTDRDCVFSSRATCDVAGTCTVAVAGDACGDAVLCPSPRAQACGAPGLSCRIEIELEAVPLLGFEVVHRFVDEGTERVVASRSVRRGATVELPVPEVIFGGAGIEYRPGTLAPVQLRVSEDTRVTYEYLTFYRLTVQSSLGETSGQGWFRKGTLAEWSVHPQSLPLGDWTALLGGKWVARQATGTRRLDGPATVAVDWVEDRSQPALLFAGPIGLLALLVFGGATQTRWSASVVSKSAWSESHGSAALPGFVALAREIDMASRIPRSREGGERTSSGNGAGGRHAP